MDTVINEELRLKPHNTKGHLITFCGLDGCGKSTMIKRFAKWLQKEYDISPFLTREPTNLVRNSEIFRTFMDCRDNSNFEYRSLSLLAASDRVQHSAKVILPLLQKGETVISDRYFYSCLANLRARGYKFDKWIYEISESIVKPELAFFIDVPVEIAIDRVRQRPEEKDRYIDIELQCKLREQYKTICKENGGILLSSEKSEDATFADVCKAYKKLMGKED
ncbi:MAG: dTMP kinase [Clostridia bacterium]|nr:dTMP kinase [Clostridia bacterium]